jgi:hypothetical protein
LHYGTLLFKQAAALKNNWFVVEGVPRFLWRVWTTPCTEIQGRELSWEWYLRVQDVFFRGMLQAYYEGIEGEFAILRGMAYPINTIVPRGEGGEESGDEMRGRVA